jgi:xylulokinase
MAFLAVDLGSTNIKVALYGDELQRRESLSQPVRYIRENSCIEFDAEEYLDTILEMIASLVTDRCVDREEVHEIVMTGQAESLVVLGDDGRPLMNAISWMDERSIEECRVIEKRFSASEIHAKTGQMSVLPTWPATKILWLRTHREDLFGKIQCFLLLKDFLVERLTGRRGADPSIATFSLYFDIHGKCYWQEMLETCGIRKEQLPPFVEPCTNAGPLLPDVARRTGLTTWTTVNTGTLDHFAGMIGTGNTREGILSLSTGTVMSLATMVPKASLDDPRLALHYGFVPDSYICLSVAESGGVCLEWYRNRFLKDCTFRELDDRIARRGRSGDLLFLPYISGTNAPEFDSDASGMFFGIRTKHDEIDFAIAIMEGVALLLAKNIDELDKAGIHADRIIATGGGAKSDVWCQIQADVTGLPVEIPEEKEAACLGAAMIGAVDAGLFGSFEDAACQAVRVSKRFLPAAIPDIQKKRRQFDLLYDAMIQATRISS